MSASAFFPGSLYMHDLAVIGSNLFANAVGHNAITRLGMDGRFERVWWPQCVERNGDPDFTCNYIQLNSIAAGPTLRSSYFSASSASIGRYRPGHLSYPVDKRGVIFSGKTREPVCTGLTRPHSARLRGRDVWVANSGRWRVGLCIRRPTRGRYQAVWMDARVVHRRRCSVGRNVAGDPALCSVCAGSRSFEQYMRDSCHIL